MADVQPLRALHYDLATVGPLDGVVAPPYDVIDAAQRAALAARSPYNVVEIDLPRADDGDAYAHAAQLLASWRAAGAVARLNVDAQLVTLPEHHRGRPDFDVAFHRFVGLEPQPLIVRMIRAVGQRALGIELAMRRAQPALGHARHRLAMLADLAHVFAVGADIADRGENIHVFRGARHPQLEHERACDLGVLCHRRGLERHSGASGVAVRGG